jgi:hypothetical protein
MPSWKAWHFFLNNSKKKTLLSDKLNESDKSVFLYINESCNYGVTTKTKLFAFFSQIE